ncbi:hypothetical protein K493DRAFT_360413 [Basidiobolus meristosporus CBS 931.73]|uniref:Uncharacterized protein n=1 Tax=Basidiobolus meristosporus CBS 931.73 TaxID=1314790 RepID=A0A1Y1XI70_9FUNG|nr:hypothetical protein K493DRAFT_360413 [Basidiobolus meristosporus CBS 931.73]|eukprot:ORX85447.1 hypothetical protein K493DRAFT_360413 [Basidiobolus meristosporus CBS 931.73]
MNFRVLAAILGLATLEVVTAVPAGYSTQYTRPFKKVYLQQVPCGQQAIPCYPNGRTFVLPSAPVAKVPLLRQIITTVTRKHDNLNVAHAERRRGLGIKYQAGPSLELEGSAGASEYAKRKGAEHSGNEYPYVYMQPAQELYVKPTERSTPEEHEKKLPSFTEYDRYNKANELPMQMLTINPIQVKEQMNNFECSISSNSATLQYQ